MAYAELLPTSTVASTWNTTGSPQHDQIAKTGSSPSTATNIYCGADGKIGTFRFTPTLPGNPQAVTKITPELYLEGVVGVNDPAFRVVVMRSGVVIGQITSGAATGSGNWRWLSFDITDINIIYSIFSGSDIDMVLYSIDGDAGYPDFFDSA